jgi:hypothetical protein
MSRKPRLAKDDTPERSAETVMSETGEGGSPDECTRGRGAPPCGACEWCRWYALTRSRPKNRPGELHALRHLAGIPSTVHFRVGVYDGTVIDRRWRGYAVELVMVPTDAVPISAHPVGVQKLDDVYPAFPEPLAVIRYRVWKPGHQGFLEVVWDRRDGERYAVHDFPPSQHAEAESLLALARGRGKPGRPRLEDDQWGGWREIVEQVEELKRKQPTLTYPMLARRFNVAESTLRYWRRKCATGRCPGRNS